ncbi:MAG: hypothetical protein IPF97_06305 [Sphingomonadales bacterium]|nr:hypothetical protein [Sphingomonadales bacterium]
MAARLASWSGLYNRGLLQAIALSCSHRIGPNASLSITRSPSEALRVALSHRLHPKEVAEIVADCEARAIIVESQRMPEIVKRLPMRGVVRF